MGAVGDFIGGATDFLVGGDQKAIQGDKFAAMTEGERKRLQAIEAQIESLFGDQSKQQDLYQQGGNQFVNLFQNQLKSFLTGGSSNPNPTEDQLQQATSFVDATFTNPSQMALKQYGNDFASQAAAQAAALGRNPNADIATQQAIAGEIARQGLGLQAERGARIQQSARQLNDVGYNRGLNNLQAGMQGSGFLNSLGQQAFNNRLGLINGRTGLAQLYQSERGKDTTNNVSTSSGLFTNLNSIVGGASDLAGSVGRFGGQMGGLGGIGGGA